MKRIFPNVRWLLCPAPAAAEARVLPGSRRQNVAKWLAVPVEPLLGEAGKHVPAAGALHALAGVSIATPLFRLLAETASRRRAATRPGAPRDYRYRAGAGRVNG